MVVAQLIEWSFPTLRTKAWNQISAIFCIFIYCFLAVPWYRRESRNRPNLNELIVSSCSFRLKQKLQDFWLLVNWHLDLVLEKQAIDRSPDSSPVFYLYWKSQIWYRNILSLIGKAVSERLKSPNFGRSQQQETSKLREWFKPNWGILSK